MSVEIGKKIIGELHIDFEGKDQRNYNFIRLTVGNSMFDFKSGNPVVDWVNYVVFLANNFEKLNIGRIDHAFSVEKFFMRSDYFLMAYFDAETGRKIPTKELIEIPMPEWNRRFERYIVADGINNLEDLRTYYHENKLPEA